MTKCPQCTSSKTYPAIVHPAFAVEIWNCPDCRISLEVVPRTRQVRSDSLVRLVFQKTYTLKPIRTVYGPVAKPRMV